MTTPAEELRAAAALIRKRTEKVITGDGELFGVEWFADHSAIGGPTSNVVARDEGTVIAYRLLREVAEHIATWSPAQALAVAALLEQVAGRHVWVDGQNGGGDWSSWCRGCGYFPADPESESCPDMAAALAVARALGGQP